MDEYYDIVVVGGGPAGSMAAYEAAKQGAKVCLFDKDRDIGYPVRCGEAIAHGGLAELFEVKKEWIASKIDRINLVSPSGVDVEVPFAKETGYILHRRIFDYDLSRMAAEAGAEIYTKSYVKSLIYNDDRVAGVNIDILGEEKLVRSKIVIGADGIASRVGRMAGLKTSIRMKDMESCVQYSVSNVDVDTSSMVMYVGSEYAPGGYLWIFPKGNKFANIGLGISGKYSKHKSAKEYLDGFLSKNFPKASILTTMCGGVPCPPIMKNPCKDSLMLAGDAAHQINPLTGGGISSALRGGQLAGKVAAMSIKAGDTSEKFLSKYSKDLYSLFGKNYDRFYRIKEAISKLKDEDINYIANKVSKTSVEKRNLGMIFKAAIYKKPSLVFDVLKVFAGM